MPAPAAPLHAPVPRHHRRPARRRTAALVLSVAVAVLAACGSAEKVTTLGATGPAGTPIPERRRSPWPPWPGMGDGKMPTSSAISKTSGSRAVAKAAPC
jgi:hypothetical protein